MSKIVNEPKTGDVWRLLSGRIAMIVNNFTPAPECKKIKAILWYDEVDKDWNVSPIDGRLFCLLKIKTAEFFKVAQERKWRN